jgi:TolB-like protein/class 3 adenylate cyclase/rhodanese-related sulfurtransferase
LERRLTTILAADVVGYSRLMGEDEAGTLAALKALRRNLVKPKEIQYHGRTVKLMGDGALMEFSSVVDAVHFAVEVQAAMAERNAAVPEDRRIVYRMGLNIGDIIVEGDDIFGDGVNVAARLEGLSDPGGVCLARSVFDQVKAKLDLTFEHLGEKEVKNIAEPVSVYRVVLDDKAAALVTPVVHAAKTTRQNRWPTIAAAFVLSLLGVAGLVWWQPWAPDVTPASLQRMAFALPGKPSIAVLPFINMSEDESQEYFVDGMTEDLITDLSKISGLFVIARNSSFSYKGQQVKVRQVAEELGVRYVLEGSVRRAGNEVRINAQLIDATTGGHLWAERYDGTLEDIFDLQDQVTEQIVAALAVSLTGEEQAQQARHGTENAAAHDAYLQGWAHYKLLTPEELAKAVPFFEEAIRLDPDYAQAHAALASLYWDVYQNDWAFDLGMPSSRAESRANEHLEEAFKSPTPLAHALQARIFAAWGFPGEALGEAQKAVELDANDATALAGLASALIQADRPGEGLDSIEQAMRLDPHYPPSYLITLGAAQFGLESYEEAAATFERAVRRNPDNELPLIYLAAAYGHLGRIKDGDAVMEAANDLRDQAGLGGLSLEQDEQQWYSPFEGEIDFKRFGGRPVQDRVRTGLSDIPALKWQYLVIPHPVYGLNNTWWEVEGATSVDATTAKSLYDLGVTFIFTADAEWWKEGHIPGAVHLSLDRPKDPAKKRFKEATLLEVVGKSTEVVFYSGSTESARWAVFASAMALTWGFTQVYYFDGGLFAWHQAGYPVETGQ